MKTIYFMLNTMTFFKYYIPLIIEFNKNNIKSIVYYKNCTNKSNADRQNPISSFDKLKKYSNLYRFSIEPINNFKDGNGIIIDIEGSNLNEYINKNYTIISFVYMIDFVKLMHSYINKIDYCIFNGNKFIKKLLEINNINFNFNDDKHKFIGSPKYDFSYDRNLVIKKYNLNQTNKFIFLFLPKLKDLNNKNCNSTIIQNILEFFIQKGYYLLLKTRNKDDYPKHLKDMFPKNTLYINDTEWFPHPSLELIYISDFVFNFDSTGSIESIMLEKHVINFNCKPGNRNCNLNILLHNIWDEYIYINNINQLELAYNKIINITKDKKNIIKFKNEYFSNNNCSKEIINLINNI